MCKAADRPSVGRKEQCAEEGAAPGSCRKPPAHQHTSSQSPREKRRKAQTFEEIMADNSPDMILKARGVWVCVCVYMRIRARVPRQEGQMPLELELHAVVSCLSGTRAGI